MQTNEIQECACLETYLYAAGVIKQCSISLYNSLCKALIYLALIFQFKLVGSGFGAQLKTPRPKQKAGTKYLPRSRKL